MDHGIGPELDGIDLGDERLNRRSKVILEALAASPQVSINAACSGWNETLAAYRFFDNPAVEAEKILAPHQVATKQRIQAQPVVLIIQDTTELDFTSHPPQDAGCLNKPDRFGFYDHTYLAITPERLCLGVVGDEQFERTPESLGKTAERVNWPIEDKESFRWLTGYRVASELARECPDTQIVSVADCEADLYDIFVDAQEQEIPAEFVIRAKANRSIPEKDPTGGPAAYLKVQDEVRASKVRIRKTIELPQTPKREARTATLEIRAMSVTIKPPHARSRLPQVTCNVVLVEEVHGPGDGTDLSWLLITTLPIKTIVEIELIIDYYVARWMIEVYFRTLKTGCKVEEMQLEAVQRVKNCLAFYKIIAWRILYLTHLNRECPDLPCDVVFDPDEWEAAWQVVKAEPPPKAPPSLGEFMKVVAELGGYNNRPSEPPPGPQVIWMGLRRMIDFALAWKAFQKQHPQLMYK
ncbi:MAG: IS4 family transposase [Candidatus Paceibacterota bacterium]